MVVAVFALFLGLSVGSFANVILHRVPRGESVIWPASHCPACKHPLTPGELIPVASYLLLRGRCRCCRHPIGERYLLMELAGGAVAAASARWAGLPAALLAMALLAALAWGWGILARRLRTEQAGGMLAEVALSAALLVLVVASLMELIIGALGATAAAERRAVALNLAREHVEVLSSRRYADLVPETAGEDLPLAGYRRLWNVRTADVTSAWSGAPVGSEGMWITVSVEYPGGTRIRPAAVTLAALRGKDA